MTRRNRNSRRNEAAPGWVFMLFGLGLGLIVAIGVYLRVPSSGLSAVTAPSRTAAIETKTPLAGEGRATQAAPARPAENRFEFYEILPQFEVVVPEPDAPARAAVRPRPAVAPGSYLLQAGSFSAAGDADRLQANLALLGFESHVQRVTIEKSVFNRVRIGPIDDLDSAKRAQRELRDEGIDTLLMQVPK